ncbi:MAG TPA: dienelactone hydrolase family protein [Chloroflexota bacterium]|nr:dienelactone hydrolase family protein [Chloroflexota bacterium]
MAAPLLELGPDGDAEGGRLTRRQLRRLLGRMPPWAPLEPRVEERAETEPGLVRERVTYQVEPGERVPAFLFAPARRRPGRPAVLCLHQHAGQFELGKSEPAGLAGNPEQHYALELARRGFITLAPDHLCFEERRDPRLPDGQYERFEFTRRLTLGSTLQAKLSWDAIRAVDYLRARPEAGGRIGCVGHSLGGQQTLMLAALDRRIAAAVSSCGFSTLATIFRDGINHNFAAYAHGLGEHGDMGDVLALVAPRPFLVVAGRTDRIFPIDGLEAALARAGRAYRPADVAERLGFETEPGGHAFTDRLRTLAYAWLERWLDPPRR